MRASKAGGLAKRRTAPPGLVAFLASFCFGAFIFAAANASTDVIALTIAGAAIAMTLAPMISRIVSRESMSRPGRVK